MEEPGWISENDHVITAVVVFAVWLLIAFAFDRWFAARGRKLAARVLRGGISQQADTRLRFVRRLVWLLLVLIGTLSALSQFSGLGRVAGSVLASGALVAAIVGFAARQTLANLVAGIMLAITQPLRVGDWVTFEEHYGVVEDVRLNFTVLRTLGDQRIVIPNERIASGILRNDTLETDAVGLDVSLWLPAGSDVDRARNVRPGGQPDGDVQADDPGLERVVAQDPAGDPLVGDDDPLVSERAQDGEVQPHVLHDAVVLLEGDPVADPQRLGEREHDPGDEVGQRLAGGEADDRRGDHAGGQDARRDPVDARELRQRDGEAEQQDHRVDEAAHEAQPRSGLA